MKKYLLILGNSPELAKEELKSLAKFNELFFNPPLLVVKTDETIPFDRLGGTIKIAEGISDDVKLPEIIKSDFGLSDYTNKINLLKLSKEIKKETGQRFVLPSQGRELSSVVVKKQKLTEIIFTASGIFKTTAVQDFEDWGKRDYGRPAVQAHIGMLPPKVARQMINLSQGKNILDPFCGVGTILMEALEIGLNATGSDFDPRQIDRTRKNLEFFGKTTPLFICDARKIFEKVRNIDAIVTETDLGPRPGLDQLYLDCFTNWRGKVKTIVIALPSLNVIDKVKSMGYTLSAGPFIYARPQALVKRHICVFKYGTY